MCLITTCESSVFLRISIVPFRLFHVKHSVTPGLLVFNVSCETSRPAQCQQPSLRTIVSHETSGPCSLLSLPSSAFHVKRSEEHFRLLALVSGVNNALIYFPHLSIHVLFKDRLYIVRISLQSQIVSCETICVDLTHSSPLFHMNYSCHLIGLSLLSVYAFHVKQPNLRQIHFSLHSHCFMRSNLKILANISAMFHMKQSSQRIWASHFFRQGISLETPIPCSVPR